MAHAILSPSADPDRLAAWLWTAVKAMGIACAAVLGLQLAQFEPKAAPAPPPPAPAVKSAPAPAPAIRVPGADFPVRRVIEVDRPMTYGDYAWDETGAGVGELRVLVDLDGEMLRAFRGGREIGRAVILYGTDGKPTPTGSFRITERKIDHVSNIYGAPMPFMLRLTNDGIAIHGSMVERGGATRGCIGIPDEFAALLFEEARLGTRVTIVSGVA